jgi:hypothetical protein
MDKTHGKILELLTTKHNNTHPDRYLVDVERKRGFGTTQIEGERDLHWTMRWTKCTGKLWNC